jgi:hypothetical protein
MAKNKKADNFTIGDALKQYIGNGKLAQGLDQVNVKDAWYKVMGSGVAGYTTAVILERDVLFVSLSSSVLREELSYGKPKIVRMINEELGKMLVDKIVLR